MMLKPIFWVGLFVVEVYSHSWLACVDYTEKNGNYWDPEKCRGFPRDSARFASKNSFGLDRGFDHKPGMEGKACKTDLTSSSYDAEYPKAVYYPGQQVILIHPMKNHGASAQCTNIHIPDFGNRIYHGMEGTDTNRKYSYYRPFLVADLGISPVGAANTNPDTYPKPGYQNAPKFCENTDKSMGSYSFNIPKKFPTGNYTFVWRWSFNGPTDIYTTCFDVTIAQDKAERDKLLKKRSPSTDLWVACGGIVSDEGDGSVVGCDEVPTVRPTLPPATTDSTLAPIPTTTRPLPVDGERVDVNVYQLAGEINLGVPSDAVKRRLVAVQFDCLVEVTFFNARLVDRATPEGDRKKREIATNYKLLQENPTSLKSGKIYFTATFDFPCDIVANPPMATLLRDTK